jgi:hypothetical protein
MYSYKNKFFLKDKRKKKKAQFAGHLLLSRDGQIFLLGPFE